MEDFRSAIDLSIRSAMMAAVAGSVGVPVPSVSSPVEILFSDATGVNNVGIVFNEATVGTLTEMVKRHDLTFILMGNDDAGAPVDHTGEWASFGNPALFEVACDSLSMGTWSVEAAAVGVFIDMSVARAWTVNRGGGKGRVPGTTQVIGVFTVREIADTGNSTTFTVDVTNIQT
jgi:hypothetical protein